MTQQWRVPLVFSIFVFVAAACAPLEYFPPGTFVLESDKIAQGVFERNLAAMHEPTLAQMENLRKAIRVSWFYPPEWNSTLQIVEKNTGEVLSVYRKFSFDFRQEQSGNRPTYNSKSH